MRVVLPSLLTFGALCVSMLTQAAATHLDTPDETPSPLDAAARVAAFEQRAALEGIIGELEAQHVTHGVELSEAYVALGRVLRLLGDDAAAAEAFGKGLHALRVGYGLEDLRQLPILAELRDAREALGEWSEVRVMYYLALNIAMRNDDEDLRVRSLRDLDRWMRRAAEEKLVRDHEADTDELIALYEREARHVEDTQPYAGRNRHLAALYLDLAGVELREAKRKHALPLSEFATPGFGEQSTRVEQNCFAGLDSSGRPVTLCSQPMTVTNMNYYLAPNMQKANEIRGHLVRVEHIALKALGVLRDTGDTSAQQAELLSGMQRLATEYNAFVQEQRNQETALR